MSRSAEGLTDPERAVGAELAHDAVDQARLPPAAGGPQPRLAVAREPVAVPRVAAEPLPGVEVAPDLGVLAVLVLARPDRRLVLQASQALLDVPVSPLGLPLLTLLIIRINLPA